MREEFLRPKEVADLLRVNVQTIYRWVQEGKLEYVKAGWEGSKGAVLIPRRAVVRFIRENYGPNRFPARCGDTLWSFLSAWPPPPPTGRLPKPSACFPKPSAPPSNP